jgi:hypothetical protein
MESYTTTTSSSVSSDSVKIIISPEDTDFDLQLFDNNSINNFETQSAITMSNENSDSYGSDSGSGSGSGSISDNDRDPGIRYKTITSKELEGRLKRDYSGDEMKNEIDIISIYVKNQKNIYTEAKTIMKTRLYVLSIPSACISITSSVLLPFAGNTIWGIILLTSMSTVLSIFLILLIVLKLETYAVKYEIVANKYTKIHEELEGFTYKLASTHSRHEKDRMIYSQMKRMDRKITELKEDNRTILPYYIRYVYPKISAINIFSSIHSVELHRKNLINSLKSVINEDRYINAKWETEKERKLRDPEYKISGFDRMKESKRLKTLENMKVEIKKDLAKYKNTCSFIDGVFQQEINTKNKRQLMWLFDGNIDLNEKILKFD